jgi:lipopolysaccharide biosynthesis regulator YciM
MRVEKRSQVVTIGEGEKAITLEVECDSEEVPLTVRMVACASGREHGPSAERTSVEVIERVAAVLKQLRGDHRLVCVDHGYHARTESWRCPRCHAPEETEKPAA